MVLSLAQQALRWGLIGMTAMLCGCTGLFFFPDRIQHDDPARLGLNPENVWLRSGEKRIHAWYFAVPAGVSPQGAVLFAHGNAQNLSSHFHQVSWLPSAGYAVLIHDYQGYGRSEGEAGFPASVADTAAAAGWLQARHPRFVVFGQSLGGAIALQWLAGSADSDNARPDDPCNAAAGLIVDSTFIGWQAIAREKLGRFWLTWPLQYPLSWLVTAQGDPLENLQQLPGLPKLILYSHRDEVIPGHHGEKLSAAAAAPVESMDTGSAHNQATNSPAVRKQILEWLGDIQTGHNKCQQLCSSCPEPLTVSPSGSQTDSGSSRGQGIADIVAQP